jgi:type IV secretory pathway VirB10-like protein
MTEPSKPPDSSNLADSTKSKWSPTRWAIIASVVFHIVLASVLLAWYFPKKSSAENEPTAAAKSGVIAAEPKSVQESLADLDGNLPGAAQQSASRVPPPANDVPTQQIESSLRSAIDSAATVSEERKLSELERNVRRLEQVASERSLAEVGEAIRSATGLEERASVPAAQAVGGNFDFDSAQFHDVSRQTDNDGKWVYRSILIDAKGRTIEVDLSESEGKTAYETMQMVKVSPFAETIYRSMVMPMLDKLIPPVIPNSDSKSSAVPEPSQAAAVEAMP